MALRWISNDSMHSKSFCLQNAVQKEIGKKIPSFKPRKRFHDAAVETKAVWNHEGGKLHILNLVRDQMHIY